MASMPSLGCKLRKQNLDKFVPVLARTHFSCTTDHKAQMLVQREDEDICKIEEHPQCVFSNLDEQVKRSLDTEVSRRLPPTFLLLAPSLFLFDGGHPSLWRFAQI